MFILNKNIRVIKSVVDYYDGRSSTIPFKKGDVENAINYTKRYRSDYPDDIIEKLRTVKVMLESA